MGKYRSIPTVVNAWHFTNDGAGRAIQDLSNGKFELLSKEDRENSDDPEATGQVFDDLHNTWILVYTGQWIIRGTKGEYYPCDDEVFKQKYEEATDDN